jgi:hypothetical protein
VAPCCRRDASARSIARDDAWCSNVSDNPLTRSWPHYVPSFPWTSGCSPSITESSNTNMRKRRLPPTSSYR